MPDMARTLGMLGFNRVSLGVQDLDPTVRQPSIGSNRSALPARQRRHFGTPGYNGST